jgi:hypothetical protein
VACDRWTLHKDPFHQWNDLYHFSEWLFASYTGGAAGFATWSVRPARGSEESQNVPEPAVRGLGAETRPALVPGRNNW